MPRRFTFLSFVAATLLPAAAFALQVKPRAIPNAGVFGVELAGTDSQFYARADHVLSVSWQEYTTGTYIVSEVVVDMAGSNQQIRLYSLRAPSSDESKDALTKAGSGLPVAPPTGLLPTNPLPDAETNASEAATKAAGTMPVKSYPATTHSHTVEYVVGSRAELKKFYTSFRDLLCAREVVADQGASVSGNSGTNAFGTPVNNPSNVAGKPTVNRLGGTVFFIEP